MKIDRTKLKNLASVVRFLRAHWFKTLCGAFVIYMCFCGDYSLMNIMSLKAQESALRDEIEEYQDSIKHFEERINELDVNSEQLERYAREHMFMHGENEDVYILDD